MKKIEPQKAMEVVVAVSAVSLTEATASASMATTGWKTNWMDGVRSMGPWGRFLSRFANAHLLSYLRPVDVCYSLNLLEVPVQKFY